MNNVPIYLDEIKCDALKKGIKYIIHDPKHIINTAKIGVFINYKKHRGALFANFRNLLNYDITNEKNVLGTDKNNMFSCRYYKFYISQQGTMKAIMRSLLEKKVGGPHFAKYMSNVLFGDHTENGRGVKTIKKRKRREKNTKKRKRRKKIKKII